MKATIGLCLAVSVISGCVQRTFGRSAAQDAQPPGSPINDWRAVAKKQTGFQVRDIGNRFVFNWTFNPNAVAERERRLARFSLRSILDVAKNYRTIKDVPAMGEMGDGLYVAHDPFVSSGRFGNILSVYRLGGEAPMVGSYLDAQLAADYQNGQGALRLEFIKSDAEVLLYGWQSNATGFTSAVVREGARLNFVDIIDVFATPRANFASLPPVNPQTDIVGLARVLAPFAVALNTASYHNPKVSRAFLSQSFVTTHPGYFSNIKTVLRTLEQRDDTCTKSEFRDERSVAAMCLSAFAKTVFPASDFQGMGLRAENVPVVAAALGLIPAGFNGDATEAVIAAVTGSREYQDVQTYLDRNIIEILNIYSKNSLSGVPLDPGEFDALIAKGTASAQGKITVRETTPVRDESGRPTAFAVKGQKGMLLQADARSGTAKISFQNFEGRTVVGIVPVLSLGFGWIDFAEDI